MEQEIRSFTRLPVQLKFPSSRSAFCLTVEALYGCLVSGFCQAPWSFKVRGLRECSCFGKHWQSTKTGNYLEWVTWSDTLYLLHRIYRPVGVPFLRHRLDFDYTSWGALFLVFYVWAGAARIGKHGSCESKTKSQYRITLLRRFGMSPCSITHTGERSLNGTSVIESLKVKTLFRTAAMKNTWAISILFIVETQ